MPIISDEWPGLEDFFVPGEEIFVARDANDTLRYLRDLSNKEARAVGAAGRRRVLSHHTAQRRAAELEAYLLQLLNRSVLSPAMSNRVNVT
jgi:spore maturation protein CgeB